MFLLRGHVKSLEDTNVSYLYIELNSVGSMPFSFTNLRAIVCLSISRRVRFCSAAFWQTLEQKLGLLSQLTLFVVGFPHSLQ